MNDHSTVTKNIGKKCSDLLDSTYSEERINALKDSIVTDAYKKHSSPWRYWPAAAAVLILAGVTGWFWFSGFNNDSAPLEFKTGDNANWQVDSAWLQTNETELREINFKQGSRIKLLPETSLRVAETGGSKVHIYLNRGTVHSRIKGDHKTQWYILCGPYRVEVVGTEFTTTWLETSGRFEVSVTKGIVRITGGTIGKEGINVFAGSNFKGTVSGYQINNSTGTKAVQEHPAINEIVDQNSVPPLLNNLAGNHSLSKETGADNLNTQNTKEIKKIKPASRTSVAEQHLKNSKESVLNDLCRAGGFMTIMKQLSSDDIDNYEKNGTVNQLWCLAKAARYTGKSQVAVKFLKATRNRFPGTEQSKLAAFFMGKVIEDLQGDHLRAKEWFLLYLQEDPSGSLADEAARKVQ